MLISGAARGLTAVVVHRQEVLSTDSAGTFTAASTHVAVAASSRRLTLGFATKLEPHEYTAMKVGQRKRRSVAVVVASSDPVSDRKIYIAQ
jgi:hypothetical protein